MFVTVPSWSLIKIMRERELRELGDVFQLEGRVSTAVLGRVIQCGGIPYKGLGSYSVLNALKGEKAAREQVPSTLKQRREDNRAHSGR